MAAIGHYEIISFFHIVVRMIEFNSTKSLLTCAFTYFRSCLQSVLLVREILQVLAILLELMQEVYLYRSTYIGNETCSID